jgi:polysaccharide biosynthesis transport protein
MPIAEPSPPKSTQQASGVKDEDNIIERRTLRDYYIILRERLWIALPLALLVAVPMGYFKARETPMYASTATMQFEKPETIVTSQVVVDSAVRSDIELNTNIQILESARLRTRVVESFTPEEVQILQRAFIKSAPPGTPPPSAAGAIGSVSIAPAKNSLLISVTARHPDPQAAALVANRYVSQFMNYLIERVGGINETAVEFLKTRAEQLRKESEDADQKLQAYMKSHNLVSLDKSKDIIGDRLKTISGTLTNAQLARLSFENQNALVENYRKEGRNLVEIQYIATHGTVPSLNAQLANLLQTESVLAERYLERHPKMVDLSNNIAVIQEQLAKAIDLAIADLSTRLNEARETERTLQLEFNRAEKESLALGDVAVEYKSFENQAVIAKSNYAQILDRLSQTTTTKNIGSEKIPIHQLDPALPAGSPYAPNIRAITRSCIGVGVLVFLGVAIGLSFIDDRIKSAWDVESFIGANLLGIIPDLAAMKDDEKYTLLLNNKQAPGVEAFLSVYSSVKIHSKLDFPKVDSHHQHHPRRGQDTHLL